MKKKWLALPLALAMAGMVVLGACGENKDPVVTVQDGYVYVDGKKTDVTVDEGHEPVVTVQDGYVYVDGQKTDIAVNEPPEEKSAFQLWKEKNPGYRGTEEEWNAWLAQLTAQEEEDTLEYHLIENGTFHGSVLSGSATTKNGALKLEDAILRLPEGIVLPTDENASWEVTVTGTLLTGTATGAQFFAGDPFTEFGRVYLGVNKNSKMLYIGVRLNSVYVNYGWQMSSGAFFNAKHTYRIGYENGAYSLTVDDGAARELSDVNFNQANQQWLDDAATGARDLNGLIRTVAAQDSVEMTNLGTSGFTWNAEIENFTVKTTVAEHHKRMLSHPLASTKIFYLGSSITRGERSDGVAFGEILHALTNNPFQKEAVSGTTLADNGSNSYVQRLKNFDFSENPDYLVVQLSTNDFTVNGTGMPLGSVEAGTASAGFDKSTVSGAIQYIIAYAKEQCPTCKVVFYTGAVRSGWTYRSKYESYINGDFAAICDKWDIEPIDIFHTPYTTYSFFLADDIHPTIEGYSFGWTPLFMQYFMDRL